MSTHHCFPKFLIAAVLIAGLAGCAAPEAATQSPPETPTPVTVDAITWAAPSPQGRAPTEGPAPTATPDTIFSVGGPWLFFLARSEGLTHLWAANTDGTGLHKIVPETVHQFAVRPTRNIAGQVEVAYVTSSDAPGNPDLTLKLITLPGSLAHKLTALTSPETGWQPGDSPSAPDTLKVEIASGLARETSLSWSPDGKWLAFGSAQESSSIDVYSYNSETTEIKRLTSEPGHATHFVWSSNSSYVVYASKECFTCRDDTSHGLWAAIPDGSPGFQLEDPADGRLTSFVTQISSGVFLVAADNGRAGLGQLRLVDLATGSLRFLADEPGIMTSIIPDTDDGVALIDVNKRSGIFPEPGWYLVDTTGAQRRVLGADGIAKEWDPATGLFVNTSLSQAGPFAFTPAGDMVDAPAYRAYPSPDGATSVMIPRLETIPTGIWLRQGSASPRHISDVHYGLYRVGWSPDSQSFTYEDYETLLLVRAPDFIPVSLVGDLGPAVTTGRSGGWNATWTP